MYEPQINAAIELLIADYDPSDEEDRVLFIETIMNWALQGDEMLYKQLSEYIENSLDLAGLVRAQFVTKEGK